MKRQNQIGKCYFYLFYSMLLVQQCYHKVAHTLIHNSYSNGLPVLYHICYMKFKWHSCQTKETHEINKQSVQAQRWNHIYFLWWFCSKCFRFIVIRPWNFKYGYNWNYEFVKKKIIIIKNPARQKIVTARLSCPWWFITVWKHLHTSDSS